MYAFRRIEKGEAEAAIKELFRGVFTAEPWNDDWTDERQLDAYLSDLTGQSNSLTFGLTENGELVGVSMGCVKHWFTGTEYCIDELCIRADRQGRGAGTYFLRQIENEIKKMGIKHIFLQTEQDVPAYGFYRKNGFCEMTGHVSFVKQV